jgi:IS30 family transposase
VQGYNNPQIAKALGRHRSTIWREVRRNGHPTDGRYKVEKAIERANGRRRRSRSHARFSPQQLDQVWRLIQCRLSPEQVSGYLKRTEQLRISHETIYRHLWRDKRRGGCLHRHLRCAIKRRRKRYGAYDSRGRLAGKKMIHERPASVETRRQFGHWEIDTVLGKGSRHCIVTIVERKSGYTLIGKLASRTKEQASAKTIELIQQHRSLFRTITADNGTEFHGYADIEAVTNVPFYFAHPHHSWERGTNENTNGLIRQYLPKNTSMKSLSQEGCDQIAKALNTRPRKRHAYRTPEEMLFER